MDSDAKVQRYLAELRLSNASSSSSTGGGGVVDVVGRACDEKGSKLRTLRSPGTGAHHDAHQFVATSGEVLAHRAREILTKTEQQKRLRNEQQKQRPLPVNDDDSWQEDLDTWRRKRKNRLSSEEPKENPAPIGKGAREDILTIRSPEDNNDSGIENRASDSPSTSIDFSPRSVSVDAVSPKVTEASPYIPQHQTSSAERLDQVLIPLSAPARPILTKTYDEDYPPPPSYLNKNSSEIISPQLARATAAFPEPAPKAAEVSTRQSESSDRVATTSLLVELNREQKAHVSASKFPRREQERTVSAAPARSTSTDRAEMYRSEAPRTLRTEHRYTSTSYHALHEPSRMSHATSTPNMNGTSAPPRSAPAVYRTVDIPFDDTTAATYQPARRDRDGLLTIVIDMSGQPVHKGFGFSVTTERRRCVVDSVIVGTPADRQGILIGDIVHSIDGEAVNDKYPSAINRMLQDAARRGEVHLRIERAQPGGKSFGSTPDLHRSSASFDQARSVFNERSSTDSYAEFKRKHTKNAREVPSARDYNSLPRSSSGSSGFSGYIKRRDNSLSSYRTARESFEYASGRSQSSDYKPSSPDYKVTSLHERSGPGKLTDFVPEVERNKEPEFGRTTARQSYEEPKTIRNYELNSTSTALHRSVEPPVTVSSSATTRAPKEPSPPPAPPTSAPPADDAEDETAKTYVKKKTILKKTLDDDYAIVDRAIDTEPEELEQQEEIYTRRETFHTVGMYGLEPPSRRYTRSKSSDWHRSKDYQRDISDVSHRFYDRDGQNVERATGGVERTIPIRREPGPARLRRYEDEEYEREERRRWEREQQETRNWRDLINEQRHAAPGKAADTERIRQVQSSMRTLPAIIDRKHEESRRLMRENGDYQYKSLDRRREAEQPAESYERTEYTYYEKSFTPSPAPRTTSATFADRSASEARSEFTQRRQQETTTAAALPPVASYESKYSSSGTQERQDIRREVREEQREPVVAVSGKHKCAHCGEELGRGAAMIVESLNLYYHLSCFKCYVCKTSLGSGNTGADVRVRDGRLHCQSCYSYNSIQLSKV